ncbi:MAG: glycoside hydrolase, partial [Opitutaceae bacterium]|nr:glycoside hydrolase [Opitutaceae bacterium]
MKTIIPLFTLIASLPLAAQTAGPIRPLAQNHIIYDKSPDAQTIPLYTPSILRLPGGRLVGANERSGAWRKAGNPWARISTSDDGGKTWTLRATAGIAHGRLFRAGKSLYYLGHDGNLQIMRSDDNGETWSKQVALTNGQSWHQTAANVWHAKGNVYLVMERSRGGIKGWGIGALAPVLMRAKETDDLTKRESWTFASELFFEDLIPGYKENNPRLAGFGIPFFKQAWPETNWLAPRRPMHPMGWLETNVVQITDPAHYWHDPSGRTFHLFMRAHTGGTGYAALAKVVENKDGTMTTSLVTVPSGQTMLFLPFPGGQMRFHVLYDKKTKRYWLLGTQATDSMSRVETLAPDRFDLPNNERQRMVLHFSKNMVDWCFAGLVAVGPGDKGSRHYASMDID